MRPRLFFALAAVTAPFAATYGAQALAAETAVKAPTAKLRLPAVGRTETVVLAGGCFWGVEAVFEHVKGVTDVVSGYAGGTPATANYDTVSTGGTRHAEAVRITYDPRQVNYADLLRIYFSVVADPTLMNRQGPDHGPQYRSAIFPQTPAQAKVARLYRAAHCCPHVRAADRHSGRGRRPVLRRRALPPELHGPEPVAPVHSGERSAEGHRAESDVPGRVARLNGAPRRP